MSVDEIQDGGLRAKISCDFEYGVRIARFERNLCDEVGSHVGTTKTVDCLFGITHQKEGSRTDCPFLPRQRRVSFAGEQPQDLGLQRVGVLEFIHQDPRVAPRESLTHWLVALKEISCMMEQVVEVE